MTRFNAKRGDDAINRSSDGDASASQRSIVLRGGNCEFCIATIEDRESQQILAELMESTICSCALQYFTEHKTGEADFKMVAYCVLQPVRL